MKKFITIVMLGFMTLCATGCQSTAGANRTFMIDAEMSKQAEIIYCNDTGLRNIMYFGDKLIVVCKGSYGNRSSFIVSSKIDK